MRQGVKARIARLAAAPIEHVSPDVCRVPQHNLIAERQTIDALPTHRADFRLIKASRMASRVFLAGREPLPAARYAIVRLSRRFFRHDT